MCLAWRMGSAVGGNSRQRPSSGAAAVHWKRKAWARAAWPSCATSRESTMKTWHEVKPASTKSRGHQSMKNKKKEQKEEKQESHGPATFWRGSTFRSPPPPPFSPPPSSSSEEEEVEEAEEEEAESEAALDADVTRPKKRASSA